MVRVVCGDVHEGGGGKGGGSKREDGLMEERRPACLCLCVWFGCDGWTG